MCEVTEKDVLLGSIYDLHKEVHGFKPRGIYENCTVEELKFEIGLLHERGKHMNEENDKRQKLNAIAFEEKITEMIGMGASNRDTAIRWMNPHNEPLDYVEWEFDLPYGYLKKDA